MENVAEGYCFNISVAVEWLFFCENNKNNRTSKMKLDDSGHDFVNGGLMNG